NADPGGPAAARRKHGRRPCALSCDVDAAARRAQLRRDRVHRAAGAGLRGLPMSRRAVSIAGGAALFAAWAVAAAGHGMTLHMVAHMTAVAVAAPMLAYGLAGGRFDPALRWPKLVAPMTMSIVELVVVWGWHVPAARALASGSAAGLALEQLMFAAVGIGLWSACYGTRDAPT